MLPHHHQRLKKVPDIAETQQQDWVFLKRCPRIFLVLGLWYSAVEVVERLPKETQSWSLLMLLLDSSFQSNVWIFSYFHTLMPTLITHQPGTSTPQRQPHDSTNH
jgi:hypothetical protein